jgi:hypothetical protein
VADEKYTGWRVAFETVVAVLVVGLIGWACYWGCNRKDKVPAAHAVTCPACGAKLELKEVDK